MPRRRVVIMTHTAEIGGAESALLRLIGELDRERFEPYAVVLANGPLVARLIALGVPTRVLPLGGAGTVTRAATTSPLTLARSGLGLAAFIPRLARLLRSSGAELAVANSLKSATVLAAAAPLAGLRWVWHLHDRLADDYLPARTARAMRLLARRAPRVVVANSEAVRDTLGAIAPGHVVVAHPGLDAAAFEAPRAAFPDDLSAALIGILGRISETKGQREFVLAAEEVARRHPLAHFTIIGAALFHDGAFERALRSEVATRGLDGLVEFSGWADDPAAAVRSLDLLVHASPVPEPFGQVVVEAMAAGVPVIATDAGGVPEILDPRSEATAVADGVRRSPLGILVRPGDAAALARAIEVALADPAALRAAVERARESAQQRFTAAQTARVAEAAWARAVPDIGGARR